MVEVEAPASPRRRSLSHTLGGGAVAGVFGGLVIELLLLARSAALHGDLWRSLKFGAYPFLGARAIAPGFDAGPVVLGLACHLGVSAVWGMLFALLAFGMSRLATVAAGAIWGVVVWAVMYHVVLPLVGAGRVVKGAPVGGAILEHVVFGLAVAVGFLPFQREQGEHVRPRRRRATSMR